MVKVTCQYTNIEFEATSKRSKNHPVISSILSEAHRDGWYNAALEALKEGREEGLITVTEFKEKLYAARDGVKTSRETAQAEAAQHQREIKQARQTRDDQNAFLRQHGYKWEKVFADFDEYEEGEPSLWQLFSSDNRAVTTAQALAEIERGVEVVAAEMAAAEIVRQQAEEEAAQQATIAAEEKRIAIEKETAEYIAWQEQHLVGLVYTTACPIENWSEWKHVKSFSSSVGWYTTGDAWYTANVGGQTVYRKSYGNAEVYYAPQEIVDKATIANWEDSVKRFGEVEMARSLLDSAGRGYGTLGSDIKKRIVELQGIEKFIATARSEVWMLDMSSLGWNIETAKTWDIPHVVMKHISLTDEARPYAQKYGYGKSFYRHPETGAVWAKPQFGEWEEVSL